MWVEAGSVGYKVKPFIKFHNVRSPVSIIGGFVLNVPILLLETYFVLINYEYLVFKARLVN